MFNLNDLLPNTTTEFGSYISSYDALYDQVMDGWVKKQVHPTEPLAIFTYTQDTSFESHWNPITLMTRGLILNTETGEVVARPFPKFFNHNQREAPQLRLDTPVSYVTDKADGSLGILYRVPSGGYAVATKGSFTSEQAIWATEYLNNNPDMIKFCENYQWDYFTPLVEIIYPANRIVLNYGNTHALVWLGEVDIESGAANPDMFAGQTDFDLICQWPFPVLDQFEYRTFGDVLAAEPRANAEGFVVYLQSGEMVKIKQDDYIQLHRIITGLNARSVWQAMLDGKELDSFLLPLPEEFHDWVSDVWAEIDNDVTETVNIALRARRRIHREMTEAGETTRKDYAMRAKDHPLSDLLFILEDNKPIYGVVLKRSKPLADWTPHSEEKLDALQNS